MKKYLRFLLVATLLLLTTASVFNVSVSTRRGVNHQIQIIRIPLYLKMLDFFDRHYNYKQLTRRIVKDTESDEARAIKIFEWVHSNVRAVPEGFPVIDDHAWHIIVRGYGADDQSQDVFTTLCNHSKLDAFFERIYTKDRLRSRSLSFVKLKQGWSVFDPYNGFYFKDSKGQIAITEDLSQGSWQAVSLSGTTVPDYYQRLFENLDSANYEGWKLSRAAIQSPLRRFIFWIKDGI